MRASWSQTLTVKASRSSGQAGSLWHDGWCEVFRFNLAVATSRAHSVLNVAEVLPPGGPLTPCYRYGADPDVLSPKGWSPLSYAKARGKYGPTEEKGIYPEVSLNLPHCV